MSAVLILDDRPETMTLFRRGLVEQGIETEIDSSIHSYLTRLELLAENDAPRALVLDMQLEGVSPLEFDPAGASVAIESYTKAGLAVLRHLVREGGPISKMKSSIPIILTSEREVSPAEIGELVRLSEQSGASIRFIPKYGGADGDLGPAVWNWIGDAEEVPALDVSGLVDPMGLPLQDAETILRTTVQRVESLAALLVDEVKRDSSALDNISARGFEEFIAHLLSQMGYEIELTRFSRDDGVDIYARRQEATGKSLLIVDCKAKKNPIEVEMVRTLFGTINDTRASRGMLATTSYFSRGARAYAQKHEYRISLQDRQAILNWVTEQD